MEESGSLFHQNMEATDRIIYTPTVFARESLLYLQEAGTLKARLPHTSARSGLSSYLFFQVLTGSGSLSYEGRDYALQPGSCVFIDCRKAYSHTTGSDLWSLSWVHFGGNTMPEIYGKYTQRGGRPVFVPKDPGPVTLLLSEIYALAASDDYIKDMKINEKLAGLLCLVMEESWHPESAAKRSQQALALLPRVRAFLLEHYTEKITLDDLSSRFFINKYYLTRIFKERYGQTIGNFVLHLRVSHAKKLLRFSDESVKDAGEAAGFADPSYFARQFRHVEGITPEQFRASWQKKGGQEQTMI